MPTFDSQVMLADVRFGSLAAPFDNLSLMSGSGWNAAIRQADF